MVSFKASKNTINSEESFLEIIEIFRDCNEFSEQDELEVQEIVELLRNQPEYNEGSDEEDIDGEDFDEEDIDEEDFDEEDIDGEDFDEEDIDEEDFDEEDGYQDDEETSEEQSDEEAEFIQEDEEMSDLEMDQEMLDMEVGNTFNKGVDPVFANGVPHCRLFGYAPQTKVRVPTGSKQMCKLKAGDQVYGTNNRLLVVKAVSGIHETQNNNETHMVKLKYKDFNKKKLAIVNLTNNTTLIMKAKACSASTSTSFAPTEIRNKIRWYEKCNSTLTKELKEIHADNIIYKVAEKMNFEKLKTFECLKNIFNGLPDTLGMTITDKEELKRLYNTSYDYLFNSREIYAAAGLRHHTESIDFQSPFETNAINNPEPQYGISNNSSSSLAVYDSHIVETLKDLGISIQEYEETKKQIESSTSKEFTNCSPRCFGAKLRYATFTLPRYAEVATLLLNSSISFTITERVLKSNDVVTVKISDFENLNGRFCHSSKSTEILKSRIGLMKEPNEVLSSDNLAIEDQENDKLSMPNFPVSYEGRDITTDGYFVGHWLGDGAQKTTGITSCDHESFFYIMKLVFKLNRRSPNHAKAVRLVAFHCSKPGDKVIINGRESTCKKHTFVFQIVSNKIGNHYYNPIWDAIKGLELNKEKRVPKAILESNDVELRLSCLAGLIQSDGYYVNILK